MKNVRIGRVAEAVLAVDLLYEEGATGDWPPTVRGIRLEGVTCKQSPRVMRIEGFDGAEIDDIACHNCVFEGLSQPEMLHHAKRICFSQCDFRPANPAPSANRVGSGDPVKTTPASEQ
jgi:unsaturated rhamnogalacturonyl hydrolase